MKEGLIVRHRVHVLTGLVLFILQVFLAQGYEAWDCGIDTEPLHSGSKWCTESYGDCHWTYSGENKLSLAFKGVRVYKGSYALLTTQLQQTIGESQQISFCVKFFNSITYHSKQAFNFISKSSDIKTFHVNSKTLGEPVSFCNQYSTILVLKFTLNASCFHLGNDPHIRNLTLMTSPVSARPPLDTTTAARPLLETTAEGTPTQIGDIQYVGVVVGAICIALFTLFSCLTIISARRSSTRESRRRDVQDQSCNDQDDRPDVVADNAPPSYDAVMACPDMYPATPQTTPPGTPDATPHLALHRRVLLNQLGNSLPGSPQSQRHSITTAVSEDWDEEQDPPPPYPGLARRSGSSDDPNTDNSSTGEISPVVSNGENHPRTNDPQSDSSPTNDQDNGPWVLNNARNNHRNLNARGNNPRNSRSDPRQSDHGERNSQEFSVRARIAEPENDDYDSVGASSERVDDIVENVVQLNNSRNQRENSPKTERPVTANIPQLTVV